MQLCECDKLKYGKWEDLSNVIHNSPRCVFDYFLKSRTPVELNRRCDSLIRLFEKEQKTMDKYTPRMLKRKVLYDVNNNNININNNNNNNNKNASNIINNNIHYHVFFSLSRPCIYMCVCVCV